jgi:predicted nucleic acid-binding protein
VTTVVDSSVVVAALIDSGVDGRWAESILRSGPVVAPHLVVVEAANILRRAALAGDVSMDVASLAHGDLVLLPIELFPYAPFAARAWELRANLTMYDAWYVAVAEYLDAPLATLDVKLSRANGPRCAFQLRGRLGQQPSER